MARRPTHGPTDAELEILRVLWQNGPSTVRDVYESLNKIRRTGYTTALKLLQIMTEKGLVKRDETRRSHVYEPAMSRDAVRQTILESFVDRLFDGSCSQLVLHALKSKQLNPAEIDEIGQVLARHRPK